MTAVAVLAIFYQHAARLERWRAGKPLTHDERIEEQKRQRGEA